MFYLWLIGTPSRHAKANMAYKFNSKSAPAGAFHRFVFVYFQDFFVSDRGRNSSPIINSIRGKEAFVKS
jgi:hypothetical protein